MSRPDESITFLRSHGFSVFRFPRASAQPLELMHREGKDLTRLEVYVVTSVLKTKKIVVSAQGESGAAVKVDVPIIQQAVGGNLKVDTAGTRESRVAFEGGAPVAFAFQAVQLVFDDSGEFLTTQQLPVGDAAARALPSPRAAHSTGGRGPVFLEARGAFVRVAQ